MLVERLTEIRHLLEGMDILMQEIPGERLKAGVGELAELSVAFKGHLGGCHGVIDRLLDDDPEGVTKSCLEGEVVCHLCI